MNKKRSWCISLTAIVDLVHMELGLNLVLPEYPMAHILRFNKIEAYLTYYFIASLNEDFCGSFQACVPPSW